MRKIRRHETASTRAPPSGGPTAIAALVQAVQVPIAAARSWSWNVEVMIASEEGTSSAPNTPCSPRAAIRKPAPGAMPHRSEVTPKPATPVAKIRRRP